mmetsp:Transcript_30043/g.66554  ORF Transcript_30043/g.66554 Transcript_30043/m.66554 type:complete len:745 (+) Transcript_30043:146-2380(+)
MSRVLRLLKSFGSGKSRSSRPSSADSERTTPSLQHQTVAIPDAEQKSPLPLLDASITHKLREETTFKHWDDTTSHDIDILEDVTESEASIAAVLPGDAPEREVSDFSDSSDAEEEGLNPQVQRCPSVDLQPRPPSELAPRTLSSQQGRPTSRLTTPSSHAARAQRSLVTQSMPLSRQDLQRPESRADAALMLFQTIQASARQEMQEDRRNRVPQDPILRMTTDMFNAEAAVALNHHFEAHKTPTYDVVWGLQPDSSASATSSSGGGRGRHSQQQQEGRWQRRPASGDGGSAAVGSGVRAAQALHVSRPNAAASVAAAIAATVSAQRASLTTPPTLYTHAQPSTPPTPTAWSPRQQQQLPGRGADPADMSLKRLSAERSSKGGSGVSYEGLGAEWAAGAAASRLVDAPPTATSRQRRVSAPLLDSDILAYKQARLTSDPHMAAPPSPTLRAARPSGAASPGPPTASRAHSITLPPTSSSSTQHPPSPSHGAGLLSQPPLLPAAPNSPGAGSSVGGGGVRRRSSFTTGPPQRSEVAAMMSSVPAGRPSTTAVGTRSSASFTTQSTRPQQQHRATPRPETNPLADYLAPVLLPKEALRALPQPKPAKQPAPCHSSSSDLSGSAPQEPAAAAAAAAGLVPSQPRSVTPEPKLSSSPPSTTPDPGSQPTTGNGGSGAPADAAAVAAAPEHRAEQAHRQAHPQAKHMIKGWATTGSGMNHRVLDRKPKYAAGQSEGQHQAGGGGLSPRSP